MSKLLAITGITGKSGRVLAEQIAHVDTFKKEFPAGIRVFVRSSSNTIHLDTILPDVQKVTGALTDKAFLEKELKGVDTLLHIAGIHWSREIVSAAAVCDVRRLILVHTTGIYSKYKAAGEEYRQIDDFVYKTCRERGILLTILRPTMIYGTVNDHNIAVFIKMVDRLPVMPVVNGARYELQPVHCRDLGIAYFDVLMHEEQTANRDFILSGGRPILLRDIFTVIGHELGKEVTFFSVPFCVAYTGAVLLYGMTLGKVDFRERVQRLCEPRIFEHDEATRAFGYHPMNFEEGIKDEIREYIKVRAK